MHMNRHSFASARRAALALLGLPLFLLGINYCLVGAVMPGGPRAMPCMSKGAVAVSSEAMPASHAGHCAAMAKEAQKKDAAPAPAAPCCIAVTPVVAPEAGKVPAPVVAILPAASDAALLTPAPVTAGDLLRATPESPPHLAARGAPSAPRAPPAA